MIDFWVCWLVFGLGYTWSERRLIALNLGVPMSHNPPMFVLQVIAGPINIGILVKPGPTGEQEYFLFGFRVR